MVFASSLFVASPARAYEDVGYDPDDRTLGEVDPDIRSTIRRVGPIGDGRALLLVVRSFEDFGKYWFIDSFLDARGGAGPERVLYLYNLDNGGSGCELQRRGGRSIAVGSFRQRGRAVRCLIPVRYLDPTHRVRWRLISESGHGGIDDRAPDTGWYA